VARRIVLTMLALIGALLITSVVPLGLIMTGQARESFHEDTVLAARALASVAEEDLSDHASPAVLTRALASARGDAQQVWVYGRDGGLVAASSQAPPPAGPAAIRPVLAGGPAVVLGGDDRLVVIMAARDASHRQPIGAVVVLRTAHLLNMRVAALWAWLGLVTVAGLLAAAVLAIMLARWVSRPLSALDGAAQRLGQGALDTRSAAGHGPPEVRRLAANFNTMAGRLETLVHGHRATMADVSHQLRTPLAALRLRLDVLSADADPVTAAELAGAQDEIARLSRLVDGLLAVARAENVVIEPVPVEGDAVIADRVAAWRPVAEERAVTLAVTCPGRVRASLGEGHLEQILDNLLANALDAVPAGGHVGVGAAETASGARVQVADDGPGMSEQQRAAAFRRFATSTPGGAGLGLAIVHRLVTSNGGSAELSQTPGGGLTVTFDLRRGAGDRVPRPGPAVPARSPISLPDLNFS
jgi:signal transduction histidine kinase